jgi:hypothetical protein
MPTGGRGASAGPDCRTCPRAAPGRPQHECQSQTHQQPREGRGGHDLTAPGTDPVSLALDAYAIEVKRYRAFTPAMLAGFWQQAEAQAQRAAKVPALAFRADRQEWRVLVPLSLLSGAFHTRWAGHEWTAEISVPAFCCLVREEVKS